MELKDCSVFQLAKTSQAGYKFWANYIADEKVTTVQAMFLILLTSGDGQTSGQLGAYSKLDSATVSGVIDRLEAMKLVKRKPSPTDRRSSLIFLEPEGVEKGNSQCFKSLFVFSLKNVFKNKLEGLVISL